MWYLIISYIILLYYFIYYILPQYYTGFIDFYIIQPILWISLSITVLLTARKEGLNIWNKKKVQRWSIGETPAHSAALIGGFQVSLLIIIGLLMGFGKSPFHSSPIRILFNIFFITSTLFGIQLSKSYLIQKGELYTNKINLLLISITLFFFIFTIMPSLLQLSTLTSPSEKIQFVGETILPLLMAGVFTTYLIYLGGALAGIAYLAPIQVFEWFSPIYPTADWVAIALVSMIGPAIGFIILQGSLNIPKRNIYGVQISKSKDKTLKWSVIAVFCILIIFFSLGFLGVKPTVITSGSMHPSINVGDIVILRDISTSSITKGDIIQYQKNSNMILHRVHDIVLSNDSISFITKGDANSQPDPHIIYPYQIQGKALFTIPKLGLISIYIKQIFHNILYKNTMG